MQLDKLWPFGLAAALTLAGFSAASGKAILAPSKTTPPEIAIPFDCPKLGGVCFWSPKAGWRKVLAASPEAITEFYQAADGRLVALLRGHGNPGQTVVATRAGAVQVIKGNTMEGTLSRVAGADDRGNVVLCSDAEGSLCDTYLPSSAAFSEPPWFPKGCLFPRFFGTALRACLVDSPKPALLLIKGERDIQKVELPDVLSNPLDFYLLSPSEFVLSAADTLYSLRLGGKLAVVARGGLLWSRQIESKILFGFYEERDGTKRGSVRRFVPGVGVEEIWSSSSFIPSMVQPARHGLFLDVWGGGHRKILYLAPEAGAPERVVWSEESSVWK